MGRAKCVLLVAVVGLLCVHAAAEDLQSFSLEEADGAITATEQHIIQEQSRIIETLTAKVQKLKGDLELQVKGNEDLTKERQDLQEQVVKLKSNAEETEHTALANQESLQKYINDLKVKQTQEERQLTAEKAEIAELQRQLHSKEEHEKALSMDLEQAEEKFNTLLKQKEEAINRAKKQSVQHKSKYQRSVQPTFNHGATRPSAPMSWGQQLPQSESMF